MRPTAEQLEANAEGIINLARAIKAAECDTLVNAVAYELECDDASPRFALPLELHLRLEGDNQHEAASELIHVLEKLLAIAKVSAAYAKPERQAYMEGAA